MTYLSVSEKNGESETPSPRLRSPRRVLENFRSFAKSFVVSTFTAQKKPVGQLAEIHLVAGAGRGEAEEPERSDGNRLYGSIADKRRLGVKVLRRFMTIKKAGIFYDLGCCFYLVAGGRIELPAFRL